MISTKAILIIPFIFLLNSCQVKKSTTKLRISQNPTLFHTKSPADKALISSGSIRPGMSRDSVYLAWGDPKHRSEGVENGVPYEEWSYEKFKPKLDLALGIAGAGISTPGLGLERGVVKTVRFKNGRVTGYRIQK